MATINLRVTLIIGDSLACVRPWDGIRLSDTYACRLQQKLGDDHYVVNWATGNNDSRRTCSESFLRNMRGSDAAHVAIQLGIVDCAPRLMSNIERVVVGSTMRIPVLRIFNRWYVAFKSKHRYQFTKAFQQTTIPIEQYTRNIQTIVSELGAMPSVKTITLINIACAGEYLVKRSYGINRNIDAYNGCLKKVAEAGGSRVTILNLYEATAAHPEWIVASDGHHILPAAHEWIAGQLAAIIRQASDAFGGSAGAPFSADY